MSNIVPKRSGIEHSSTTPINQFVPDPDTDWVEIEARQDDLNGLMRKYEGKPDKLVEEINDRASGQWDDDTGLSFLHVLGAELPNLELHGVAKGLVIAGSHLTNPNFESAELEASVFSMSVFDGLKAKYARLGMSIWSLSRVNDGDLSDVNALDSNFNLSHLDASLNRAQLTGAFMIGTQGISARSIDNATMDEVTILQKTGRIRVGENDVLRTALSSRFLNARKEGEPPLYVPARVLRNFDAESALESGHVAEGDVLLDGSLAEARLVKFDLTASVADNVSFRGSRATGMRAAGLITNNCDFSDMRARSSWLPGSVHVRPNFSNADISNGSWPGSVVIDPVSMRGVEAVANNLDGTIIVSDQEYPELSEQARGHILALPSSKLAKPVREHIARISESGLGSMGTSTTKALNS